MLLGACACDLIKEAKQLQVPLSCMQLALYNIVVVDSVSQAFRHEPMSQKAMHNMEVQPLDLIRTS